MASADDLDGLLAGQLAYYRARAAEYDEWWERRGRYDKGAELAAQWRREGAAVVAALDAFAPRGDVIELAAGTGIWTARLARTADSLTVVDGAQEMLAINRDRVAPICEERGIPYRQHLDDLFAFSTARRFDLVFFSFWLSHVPPTRWLGFWRDVGELLRPDGRFFLVDSRRDPQAQPTDHRLPAEDEILATRRLNDGSQHQVVKRFYDPTELAETLAGQGFAAELAATDSFFIYGGGRVTSPPPHGIDSP